MPKSPAPLWHQTSGENLDKWIEASLNLVSFIPDELARFGQCHATGFKEFCGHTGEGEGAGKSECWDEKKLGRKCELHEHIRQLYNANHRRYVKKLRPITSLPWPQIVKADDGTWQYRYYLTTKESGRAVVTTAANGDRANLAYDPRKKNEKKKK